MKMKDNMNPISMEGMKNNRPFTTPEGYFDNLEDRIMAEVKQKEGNFKVPVIKMMKPYLYIAASFLLLLTIGRVTLNRVGNHTEDLASNELTIDQELELIYSEVDEFTITDYLLENDILETAQE